MENRLTVEQALEMLNQVSTQYRGTREEHINLINAYETIKKALSEKEPKPKA